LTTKFDGAVIEGASFGCDRENLIASFCRVNRLRTRPGAHAAMNEAKERAVSEMMTDVDRAVMDFREDCQTALVSRKDNEEAVAWSSGKVNSNHLTHAITSADMINVGRRVKDASGVRHPVVIVDRTK